MAVDTLGGWSPIAIKVIRALLTILELTQVSL